MPALPIPTFQPQIKKFTPLAVVRAWVKVAQPQAPVIVAVAHDITVGGMLRHNALGKERGYAGQLRATVTYYEVTDRRPRALGRNVGANADVYLDYRGGDAVEAFPPEWAAKAYAELTENQQLAPQPCPDCFTGPYPVREMCYRDTPTSLCRHAFILCPQCATLKLVFRAGKSAQAIYRLAPRPQSGEWALLSYFVKQPGEERCLSGYQSLARDCALHYTGAASLFGVALAGRVTTCQTSAQSSYRNAIMVKAASPYGAVFFHAPYAHLSPLEEC